MSLIFSLYLVSIGAEQGGIMIKLISFSMVSPPFVKGGNILTQSGGCVKRLTKGVKRMFKNIEIELLKRGKTRRWLAAEIGISESSLRNKLKGRQEFTFSELERIIQIFDLPWNYLFERTEVAG